MIITYEYVFLFRAWQRKLYGVVKNKENRAQMYACLSLLISEQDVETFIKKEKMFISYWGAKEPEFTEYYEKEYSNRAGKYMHHDCTLNKPGITI